jgi:nicotinamidase-related amidase
VHGFHQAIQETTMTTLDARPNTALMVIDVQNGVVAGSHDRDGVIGNINALVTRARAEQVPVVWVQHSDEGLAKGSDDWQIVDELSPGDDEPVVQKNYGDSFEATDLEQVLAGRGVGRVVVTGAQSDACIRATLHGALVRGYDVTLVGDAHTTEDLTAYGAPSPDLVISHTNLYWQWASAPGRRGDVTTTDEVSFTAQAG